VSCQLYTEVERWDIHTSKSDVVKVSGELDRLHFSPDVEFFHSFVEVSDCRVGEIICSEDVNSFFDLVKGVDVLNREDGKCLVVSGIEQSEAHAMLQPEGVDLSLRDVEGDGDGEQCAICESQVLDHAVWILQPREVQFDTRLTFRNPSYSRIPQAG